MSLSTRYPGNQQIIIADNPANIVFGTVMLGNVFGSVTSASVIRSADLEEVLRAGSLLAAIMSNPNFQFEFDTMFDDSVDPPGLGDLITFPLANIKGRIIPDITIKWEEKGHRGLSIKAKSWDSLSDTNQGGGNAYTFNGAVYTPL